MSSLPAALGMASYALAQSGSLITVEGNKRVEADTIRSYFRRDGHEKLDAATQDAAYKALYATGLFQDVKFTPSGGRLTVSVVENPVINRLAFEGNKKAKDEQLTAEVQSKARGTFSRALVQSDVSRIVEVYHRSGRYDVDVVPKVIELPDNRVDLVFEIKEGPKTGVSKLIFVGNNSYADYRLKEIIKTAESDWLSFIKTTDMFDPDRVEADRDLLRRFYLKGGFADVRIVSASGEYDPASRGFVITFVIDEGPRYSIGSVDIISNVPVIDGSTLRNRLRVEPGKNYNADAVEKTVEDLTVEISKRGYPFAAVRAHADRDYEQHHINIAFTIDEGPRNYIERINLRGNARTRDYVIRREFDVVEGDAYNRALIDRAERRLKNLGYFKTVKITTEPGSAPDRVIVNVDLEEQSTGELSFSGGYSTSDGLIGEVSIGERNLLGRGQAVKASLSWGTKSRGYNFSFVEPFLLGERLALGVDIFSKTQLAANSISYDSRTQGANLRFGLPLTENFTFTVRYSPYWQKITLPNALNNCNNVNPDFITTFPTPSAMNTTPATTFPYTGTIPPGALNQSCYADGEASLAVRSELAKGEVFTSLAGYSLGYNTLDNNKHPTNGSAVTFAQDFAGVGGDVNFIRETIDARNYSEIFPDIIALTRGQAGYITGWGGQGVRMLDHFQGGPSLVRGFAPQGFGPRDLTPGTSNDTLGGTMYWAGTLELQTPLFFLPKEIGVRASVFADAGQLWGYKGITNYAPTGEFLCGQGPIATASPAYAAYMKAACDGGGIRSSVGTGLIWDSPFGPLRLDVAVPLSKEVYDKTQLIRFSGGTSF